MQLSALGLRFQEFFALRSSPLASSPALRDAPQAQRSLSLALLFLPLALCALLYAPCATLYAPGFNHIRKVSFTCKGGWNGSAILKEDIP